VLPYPEEYPGATTFPYPAYPTPGYPAPAPAYPA